jgi:flagella basal body P-ring formation protein FlgA
MESVVWTLARGVRRGDVLERGLLIEKTVILGVNNAISSSHVAPVIDLEPWLGFEFTQRVNAGQVINERMLKPPKLVSKGDAVVIRHRASGLELQTRGTALRDAGVREQIQVRNTSSGKIIDVVVVAPGIVDIIH